MTLTQKTSLSLLVIAAVFALAFVLGSYTPKAHATAGFLPATIATTSNPVISTSGITLFATSSCVARIVTTYASPIMLTFSDYAGQTPTATFGHLQPASTTVAYDSGQYGCGLVKAYGFVSSAITVSESR